MSKWVVVNKKADFEGIGRTFGISPVLARIIRNRDIVETEQIRKYLHGTIEDLYDPFLLKGMDQAVKIIQAAITKQKQIRIIGDYDADGICSTYILLHGIESLGGKVDAAIPHRVKDGYGLSDHLIEQAREDGVQLIITCDNGIAAAEQVKMAHAYGIQVVVTDHHEVPLTNAGDVPKEDFSTEEREKIVTGQGRDSVTADAEEMETNRCYQIPDADAVVDPKQPGETYPFAGICGAVVALKTIQALRVSKSVWEELLEPAAFATICDVMELQDENRILVKEGLKRIRETKNAGLRALIEVNELEKDKIDVYHIGFILGPCMNATGRLESAEMALNLWMETDRIKAVQMAVELKNLNESRKEMTEQGTQEAIRILETSVKDNASLSDKVLVLYLPNCHESLAGIVAGRIKERYIKPTLVLTKAEDGVKGSGRSIENYDMFAELSACKDLFTKFGGHKMAAGLSLHEQHIGELRRRLNENCRLSKEDFVKKVRIDVAMPISYATEAFIEQLKLLEPFGVGNTKPVFAHKNVDILQMSIIGKHKNVAKFRILDDGGNELDMIYFGDILAMQLFMKEHPEKAKSLTLTYYPSINEYRDRKTLQIVMTDYC